MNSLKYFIWTLLGTLLLSCSSKQELDASDYLAHFKSENYDFKSTQEVNGLTYQMKIQPIDYLLLKRWPELSENELSLKRKEFGTNELSVKFEITTPEGTSAIKYGQQHVDETRMRIQQLNKDLDQLFSLVVNDVQIACKMAYVERKYDYSNTLTLNLTFQVEDLTEKDNALLKFEDNIYYNGIIQLSVQEELKNIPTLKIK